MPDTHRLAAISERAYLDEREAFLELVKGLAPLERLESAIMHRATRLVSEMRTRRGDAGIESFLHEYGLGSEEGVALMCLAEALLRIPDSETADRLIRDKFEHAHWEKHLSGSDSLFVNASSWGLLLTGKVVNFTAARPDNIFAQLTEKLGEPVIRQSLKAAMRLIGRQFVLGEDMEEAIKNGRDAAKRNYVFSYDILGEGARTGAQAQHYLTRYHAAIDSMAGAKKSGNLFVSDSLSVKLSALHPRYSLTQEARVMGELLPRLVGLMEHAKRAGIMVAIDAEEASRLDIELALYETLLETPSLQGWNGCGFVLQAYQKRAYYVVDYLAQLAEKHRITIPLRLVKGAYWDSEIKWAQTGGSPGYPVFTRKEHTDVSYLACAQKILSYGKLFYPQFATHNARTIASIMEMAGGANYEFQRLHGMGEKLHDLVVGDVPSRIYAPVGEYKDLLAYLIRRLLENGANTSFVHLLMDERLPMAELLANPVSVSQAHGGAPNPAIPSPVALYGTRKNSSGIDFGNRAQLASLVQGIRAHTLPAEPAPLDIETAVNASLRAQGAWGALGVEVRAEYVEKAADLLEKHRNELVALLVNEAKKTLPDAIAEVREAADFCRYYALQARALMVPQALRGPTGESNLLGIYPRGVFACISPWNFPLAIFMGQVAAALVTGNAALAKPAEQTPRIAARAVKLLHEAGIPKEVVQLLAGDGAAGAQLVAHPRINGVVFTGSVDTAWKISQSLAARRGPIVPLIAETGGLNCMVVDSSALLEAAVDDIILSAFSSAGQRCSALRILLVQEEIADELNALIAGTMAELKIGDPAEPSTDVGPVIDREASDMLSAHIEQMQREATLIAKAETAHGECFIAPHAFEISSLAQMKKEIFGPVLHVLRFTSSELYGLPERINALGYGLTFGIHSRIDDHVQHFIAHVQAGNHYVNRSMTGAVVGVQPFGGEGLSGTGPKAGGPHYLPRFVTERTVSINTAAIGGNVALLAQETH